MAVAPRVVLVHRQTEREEIIPSRAPGARPSSSRSGAGCRCPRCRTGSTGRAPRSRASRPRSQEWRRGAVERSDLSRFLFEPEDVVVVVGQDGLVANRQVPRRPAGDRCRPEPGHRGGCWPGTGRRPSRRCWGRSRRAGPDRGADDGVPAAEDGEELVALNEVYLGHPGHQSARYRLTLPDGNSERHSSSGLLVGSGTGSTGWCLSIARQRASPVELPAPTDTGAEPGSSARPGRRPPPGPS